MHFRKFQYKKTAWGTLYVPPVGIGLKSKIAYFIIMLYIFLNKLEIEVAEGSSQRIEKTEV